MTKEVKAILVRGLDNIVGFKFLVIVLASVFFYAGKLSDHLWVEVCLVMAGLRAVTDVSGIINSKQAGKVENGTGPT